MSLSATEQVCQLTRTVIQHLDEWKLSPAEILKAVGLTESVAPRHIQQYRQGDKCFPNTPMVLERLEHIVGIADALRTTFPFSRQMREIWLRKPHRRFQQQSPLSLMLSDDNDGLMRVRVEVDCAYGYAISDALHAAQQRATY